MKKLLSLLGSVLIAGTSAATVVACSNSNYRPSDAPNYNPGAGKLLSVQDEEKAVEDFTKSIILSYAFGVDNSKMRDYLSSKNGDDFSTLTTTDIDQAFKGDAAKYRIKKATIGNDGGIFEEGLNLTFEKIKNWITNKIPDEKMQKTVASILDAILNNNTFSEILKIFTGDYQDDWAYKLGETVKTMLGAVSNVNIPVAMEGIDYALGLIPNVNIDNSLIPTVISGLISVVKGQQDKVDNIFTGIKDATKIDNLTNDQLLKNMHDRLKSLISPDDKSNVVYDALGFISNASALLGYYSFESNPLDKIGETEITGDNQQFNIAGLLKGLSIFVKNDDQKPIQQLMQIMLLDKDGSSYKINDTFGKDFMSLLKTNGIDTSEDEVVNVLTNKDDKDEFKNIFEGNWNDIDAFKNGLANDGALHQAFWNDDTWKEDEQPNLKKLLSLPIYKVFFLIDKTGRFSESGLGKTGLLPNIGEIFKSGTLVELAANLGSSVEDIKNLKDFDKRDFNFDNLQKLIDYLLFGIKEDDNIFDGTGKQKVTGSILENASEIISNAKGINVESIKRLSILLGYRPALDNQGAISNKFISKNSIMGQIVKTFMNDIPEDSDEISLAYVMKNGDKDNLQFLFNVIQPLMNNLLSGVDYSYWMKVALHNGSTEEPNYLWNYGDFDSKSDIFKKETGIISVDYFNRNRKNERLKSITYGIWFTPKEFADKGKSFINLMPFDSSNLPDQSLWKVTFSRDSIEGSLKIASASLNPPIIS